MHLLRTFIQLQVEAIPARYILKRYTRNARKEVPFDRRDRKMDGQDGETQSYRTKMLLTKGMAVVRAASMSKAGYEKAMEELEGLLKLLENVAPDIGARGADEQYSEDESMNEISEMADHNDSCVSERRLLMETNNSIHASEIGSMQVRTIIFLLQFNVYRSIEM